MTADYELPASSDYTVAGHDLRAFTQEWLTDLEEGGIARSLITAAEEIDDPSANYMFNASRLYANIGPAAAEPQATDDELLLAAVLGLYQTDSQLFRGRTWPGPGNHVAAAFEHLQDLGDEEAARRLVGFVIRHSEPDPPGMPKGLRNPDPAARAKHEQLMASLDQRELRAARLLAPALDFDQELLTVKRPLD